jgi:replication factor C subunit 2/4
MEDNSHLPWIEKYRPKKISDLVQDERLINIFQSYIKTGNISHLLFYGPSGTGKTSAILAICRELFKEHYPTRVIEFNASNDRGINAVREKITNEARKYVTTVISEDGTIIPPYKIIILDEADAMTDEAQDALRVIIEKYSSVTRFCFICNYICKITDAIKSRCYSVYFKKLSVECITNKLEQISKVEKIILTKNIYNIIIEISNGDLRKAVMMLQNLKYLYHLKKILNVKINDLPVEELKHIDSLIRSDNYNDTEIIEKEIYNMFAYLDKIKILSVIEKIMAAENVCELVKIAKEIVALGFPIDNVLSQITNMILTMDNLSDNKKAIIIKYSGKIFYRMKMCANEYIQLLDYITCINGVNKGSELFT